LFDKALTAEQAGLKKLQEDAIQAKDLQNASDNLNIDGKSNDEIVNLLNNLKANMAEEIDRQLQSEINSEVKKTLRVYTELGQIPINNKAGNKDNKDKKDKKEAKSPDADKKPADGESEGDPENSIESEKSSNPTLYEMLRLPFGMDRATELNSHIGIGFMKARLIKDLMFAVELDTIITSCIKYKFLKGSDIFSLKNEFLNV